MTVLTIAEKASLIGPLEYSLLKFLFEKRDNYEYVTPEILERELNLKPSEASYAIEKLKTLRLIKWVTEKGQHLMALNFSGTDILAIKTLYRLNILKSLGVTIGEGKESLVSFGYNFNDEVVAVKFHRIGLSSFKNYRKKRGITQKLSYISLSILNAKKEFDALQCVSTNYGNVPKPLGYAYNAIVMEYVEGRTLYQTDPELVDKPEEILDSILSTARIAYKYCDNMVHGDLSPYNVLFSLNEHKAYVIDWPQWQKGNVELLKRDLNNILTYFKKKYNVNMELDQAINYVMG